MVSSCSICDVPCQLSEASIYSEARQVRDAGRFIEPLYDMSRLSMFGGNADASKPPAAASSSSSSRFSVPTITSPSSSSTSSRAPAPPAKQRQSSYIASQLTNLSISGAPSAPPPLTSIVDRPVNRMRGAEVGMAAWAFLYSGIVAYSQSRVDSVVELEKRWASCQGTSRGEC